MTRLEELEAEYRRLMHAVQSGVAMEIEHGVSQAATPKHLRVGVDSAMVNDAALVKMLIAKGLFTREEYFEALVAQAREEVVAYERRIQGRIGGRVILA